ncbi:YidB family protein [Stenoxybacter acetivorans]|uniref:YidB family protein n=1 Tax=Stenoxybacter acetivorans TaxID=422441 RepID=UPI000567CECC|nr:YidB family protein [Stenoxybacter acetivorans]
MGLLDSVLGSVMGAVGGNNQQGQALQLVMQLVNQMGGVGQVFSKLQSSGLGDILQSWVSTGSNQTVSGEQISNAFGSDLINQVASKVGVDGGQAANLISQFLPMIVDQLTPNGDASQAQGADLTSLGASLLKGFLNK